MTSAKANAVLVEALGSSLRRGGNALQDVPGLLKRILEEEAWKEFVTPRGELVMYAEVEDFVRTSPSRGLGADPDMVRRLIQRDPVTLDLFDRAMQRRPGRPETLSNRQDSAPAGTTRTAALRRLRKDRPDLHGEVLAGHLSAHAAMVKAGFRRRTVSVPVDKPEAAAKALRRNLSKTDLAELARLLQSRR
ncbi:hypothetical protein [Streptomyces sp. SBT349]|uniref:hypothetical protein n=1 Tax=Streptomyces sp. SBT349 TaxID=1580539 RepID=UPI00066B174B|nr:hypothetical protein [Streptomyces sp. SBT349]